jgi:two-component system nitrate/nitrite sensor histidine kinase NarX
MRLVGSVGLPPEVVERERVVDLDCGICGLAVRNGEISISADLHVCKEQSSPQYFGIHCKRIYAVPLQHKGKVMGVYNLFMANDSAVPEEVSLLFDSISEHLGMTLENARLIRENLLVTLTSERRMMATEMHDSLAQTLAYMKMRMVLLHDAVQKNEQEKSLKYLNDVSQATESAYSSLRELLSNFRTRMDPNGLLHALHETVDNFLDKTGITLDFSNHALDIHLTADQEVQVFRIVQEALANIGKHSQAKHAHLVIDRKDNEYVVTVEDDGEGIGSGSTSNKSMHFGLNIMRERAQRLNGKIKIEDKAGQGTRVQLTFPAKVSP